MRDLDFAKLYASIKKHEDFIPHAYQDSRGLWTIGYGRLIDGSAGGKITEDEGRFLLDNDITTAIKELDRAAETRTWWRLLPEPARRALVEMCFNMGMPRLAKFERMLDALAAHDWAGAEAHALDSKWADQVGERARTIAAQFKEA